MIGAPLAYALGTGFVPVRKPGKLPGKKFSEEYALEYGTQQRSRSTKTRSATASASWSSTIYSRRAARPPPLAGCSSAWAPMWSATPSSSSWPP